MSPILEFLSFKFTSVSKGKHYSVFNASERVGTLREGKMHKTLNSNQIQLQEYLELYLEARAIYLHAPQR